MNQTKIGSGIGNYLAAEILYRAKISPHRLGTDMSEDDLDNLTFWIKYMVKLAYTDNHAGYVYPTNGSLLHKYMINLEDEGSKIKRKNYHPEIKLKEKTKRPKVCVYCSSFFIDSSFIIFNFINATTDHFMSTIFFVSAKPSAVNV